MADRDGLVETFTRFNEHLKLLNAHCQLLRTEVEPHIESLPQEEQADLNCALAYSSHALLWSKDPCVITRIPDLMLILFL